MSLQLLYIYVLQHFATLREPDCHLLLFEFCILRFCRLVGKLHCFDNLPCPYRILIGCLTKKFRKTNAGLPDKMNQIIFQKKWKIHHCRCIEIFKSNTSTPKQFLKMLLIVQKCGSIKNHVQKCGPIKKKSMVPSNIVYKIYEF